METILVKAKTGCICPRSNPAEPPITDVEAVEVPADARHLRLLLDGSLVRATVDPPAPALAKAKIKT